MSVYTIDGDLLTSDCTMIIQQANCFNKMGAGIAKQIAKDYPEVFEVDKAMQEPIGSKLRLGKCSGAYITNKATGAPMLIVNVYGQYNYGKGKQTDYDALTAGLTKALEYYSMHTDKVGVPYKLGCGYAGGDWNIVSSILEDVSASTETDIYIYKLPEA